MHILFTNTALESWTGSELYVADIARGLRSRGHAITLYSRNLGPLADALHNEGFTVVDDLAHAPHPPDLIHGQHHVETMTALSYFVETPAVYVCHGVAPWEEMAPRHPRIVAYVAVSEHIQCFMVEQAAIPDAMITWIPNFVDLSRFPRRAPLPEKASRALFFSNYADESNVLPIARAACAQHGLPLDVIGSASSRAVRDPGPMLANYDLVFARGRAALEALAVGNAVIVCDLEGLGGMVTSEKLDRFRRRNFGISIMTQPVHVEGIADALAAYDARDAEAVTGCIRSEATLSHRS